MSSYVLFCRLEYIATVETRMIAMVQRHVQNLVVVMRFKFVVTLGD